MGKTFGSVNAVLDFAIAGEIEASEFYTALAGKMDAPAMKKAFLDFAREEQGHRARLDAVKRGEYSFGAGAGQLMGLGLAEYLVEGEPSEGMSYAEALVLAMKKEKAAFKLYSDLAGLAESEPLRNLFLSLAAEEAKHKLRFEVEYDDHVMKEN
ncbi:MAG TPA: ferritin family protein [Sedimentisphaerales bacterium]|nr:ferritin family protein [Sedimentisphaerales bacterium]